ncbi:MEMO1 family [Amylocarpus encephaloides]|uniref:MEMO1 family n=1 Tax=Amylocarpus encephaloides TaxID=45428 RepID=A0A9P7Y6G5_9HELO|nr:MEMO1 family [Amylocarpus encephaloides]
MTTRAASHAGSWYKRSPSVLALELEEYLAAVPSSINQQELPIPSARVIIAPHAGYDYCADNAAWAYKSLDLSNATRVFLLGPSHTMYLSGCAITGNAKYATPFGDLIVDKATVAELQATGKFDTIPHDVDEDEHSLEMHCPYIYTMLSKHFKTPEEHPTLVPVMVGNTSPSTETEYGNIFAPYLADPTSVFVVSSDFCHWGSRFQYTYYLPNSPSSREGRSLRRRDATPTDPPIHESIEKLDRMSMDAIEAGKHGGFLDNLQQTNNTVCGRHPIGVVMAAIDGLRDAGRVPSDRGYFKFTQYSRSSDPVDASDSSVSYASAYATI